MYGVLKHHIPVAVKTDKGIDIKTQNKTVKTVAAADISNNTVPTTYVTDKDLKEWYNDSDVGRSNWTGFLTIILQ